MLIVKVLVFSCSRWQSCENRSLSLSIVYYYKFYYHVRFELVILEESSKPGQHWSFYASTYFIVRKMLFKQSSIFGIEMDFFFINTKSIYSCLSWHENLLFELLSFLNNSFEFLQYFPIGKVCSIYTSLCDLSAKHDHLSLVLLLGNSQ